MIILITLFGLAIGSFLNVLIYRLPKEEEFVKSRSYCPKCQHQLGALELIPVLSFLIQGGKCKSCKEKISIQYPMVEMINVVLYVLIYLKFALTTEFIVFSLMSSVLIVITVIDYVHQIIPDELNLVIGILGLTPIALHFSTGSIIDAVFGLVIGGGLFLLIAIVSRGAMGGGDIKLMAALGIGFGAYGILLIAFFSFIIGAFLSLILLATKLKGRKDYIPFGPFIVLSAYINLFFGRDIIVAYLNL